MSTRLTTTLSSRRAKTEVVRLLFGSNTGSAAPGIPRMLDPTIYSYDQLKKYYLERLQTIHPDKLKHVDSTDSLHMKNRFVELQEAWSKYETVTRLTRKVGLKGEAAAFTRFGVGCSFSDTPEERAQREEIMDQAGRGWFSSGAISSTSEMNTAYVPQKISLMDKDWFVDINSGPSTVGQRNETMNGTQSINVRTTTTLIPGFRPKTKR